MPASHQHVELEFNLVLRGTAAYAVDGVRCELRKNTLCFLFRDQQHLLIDESPDFEMWIGVISQSLLARACTDAASKKLTLARPDGLFIKQLPENTSQVLNEFAAGLESFREDTPRFNAGITYLFLSAWSAFQSAEQVDETREVHPAVIQTAKLLGSAPETMSIEELAQRAMVSQSHLSRLFRSQTGLTITEYRQKICLNRFMEIYSTSRPKNMMRSALEAGFGSYPQFHRVFKQHFGFSPAEYRRKLDQAPKL